MNPCAIDRLLECSTLAPFAHCSALETVGKNVAHHDGLDMDRSLESGPCLSKSLDGHDAAWVFGSDGE